MNSKGPTIKSFILIILLPLTLMLFSVCTGAYQAVSPDNGAGLPLPEFGIGSADEFRILPDGQIGPDREDPADDTFCLADETAPDTQNCGTDEVLSLSGDQAELAAFGEASEMTEEAVMDCTMADLDGKMIRLGDLIPENQVTMINIWGISCGPCLLEIPNLVRLRGQYKDRGFEIIGLTSDLLDPDGKPDPDLIEEAGEVVTDLDMTYPVLILTGEIRKQMQIIATPTTFFVDSKGKMIGDPVMGTRSEAEWDRMIRDILEQTENR